MTGVLVGLALNLLVPYVVGVTESGHADKALLTLRVTLATTLAFGIAALTQAQFRWFGGVLLVGLVIAMLVAVIWFATAVAKVPYS